MPGRARGARTRAGLLASVLLAVAVGCGDGSGSDVAAEPSGSEPSSSAPAGTGTPKPSTPATADGNGPMVPDLPELSDLPPTSRPGEPAAGVTQGRIFGADVSWPQCPRGMGIRQKRTLGLPMPTDAARFVVVGLTNGPSFVSNPCIEAQVQWIRERHLLGAAYAVVSFPDRRTLARFGGTGPFDADTRAGRLSNVGYQAAVFNMATMQRAGLVTPIVWVDVEPVPHFEWSPDRGANAAVVEGTVRGYQDGGFRVGFYSTPALWKRVVGDLRFGAPEWRAAGQTSMREALSRCGADWSIQGGEGVMGQWVEDNRDRNVTCPGAITDPGTWFHQY